LIKKDVVDTIKLMEKERRIFPYEFSMHTLLQELMRKSVNFNEEELRDILTEMIRLRELQMIIDRDIVGSISFYLVKKRDTL